MYFWEIEEAAFVEAFKTFDVKYDIDYEAGRIYEIELCEVGRIEDKYLQQQLLACLKELGMDDGYGTLGVRVNEVASDGEITTIHDYFEYECNDTILAMYIPEDALFRLLGVR